LISETKFPTERVNNFSDAIFAIAITLLVLEIKVPTVDEVTAVGINGVLNKRIANFIGYLVSFIVTALYWKNHLQLFQLVKSIDNKLFWLNLWLLFFVVIMPFSTALYSYFFGSDTSFSFYCFNLAAIGFMSYWMMTYVIKKENLTETMGAIQTRWMKNRILIGAIVFLLCVPFLWISPWLGRFGFLLIFLFQAIGDRRIKKKLLQEEQMKEQALNQ
jgi:uncharacterized membrane protein